MGPLRYPVGVWLRRFVMVIVIAFLTALGILWWLSDGELSHVVTAVDSP